MAAIERVVVEERDVRIGMRHFAGHIEPSEPTRHILNSIDGNYSVGILPSPLAGVSYVPFVGSPFTHSPSEYTSIWVIMEKLFKPLMG